MEKIEDTFLNVYKKNSINIQSLNVMFHILNCSKYRLIYTSFDKLRYKFIKDKS